MRKPRESGGDIILALSDTHVGSIVGLWPESHPVEGGGTYSCNKYQRHLLECWQDMLEHVGRMNRPILVLNGDIVQGTSPKDAQLVSDKADIQAEAAQALLEPLVKKCRAVYYIRGTEFHDGKAAESVEPLAKALGAVKDEVTGQYTRWEMLLEFHGQVIHFAHHVSATSLPWTEGNAPLRDAISQIGEYGRFYGANAPNLKVIVRSHRHRYVHVDVPPDIQAVVTPAWQLHTAFSYRRGGATLPEIGYVVIEKGSLGLNIKGKVYPAPLPSIVRVGK